MASPAGPDRAAPPGHRPAWLLAVPLALAAAAYARVASAPLLFDDRSTILDNAAVRDVGACLRGLVQGLLRGGRSVTDLSFALNHAAGGLETRGYHLTNIAIHLCVGALVFAFTRTVLRLAGWSRRPEPLAVAVAGLWALHPLQSEAVSYLSQRAESLASGFYLATLLLLLAAERRGRGAAGALAYAGALVTFLLGVGAKPILVTLPAAYLLLAWLVPAAGAAAALTTGGRRLALALPFGALGASCALATLRGSEGSAHAGFSVPGLTPADYFLTQWRVVATYLRLLCWPAGQNVDWGFNVSRSLAEPATLAAGLFLLALLAGASWLFARLRHRDDAGGAAGRLGAFGVAWFFLLLAPTSSVVPLADTLAEHRVYLASWGVILAVVMAGAHLLRRQPGRRYARAVPAVVGAAWLALAVALHARNAVWEGPVALWSDAVAKAPGHWRTHLQLGKAYWELGSYPEALRAYRAAAQQPVDRPEREAMVLSELGAMLVYSGQVDEAATVLRRAIALQPGHTNALVNLAVALLRTQDLAGAERYATAALARQPGLGRALEVLGAVRFHRGDAAGALPLLEQAVRDQPDDGGSLLYLGVAQEQLGHRAEACGVWRRMLQLPGLAPPARELAAKKLAAGGCSG
jgi:protein O-mannosyl-transferase